MEKQMTHLQELLRNNEMRIEQLFSGIELSIKKQTQTKAEMRDLE